MCPIAALSDVQVPTAATIRQHAEGDARIGIETGAMTPWRVHELRNRKLEELYVWMTTSEFGMNALSLYPLRFEPLYEYRLWGGRRLSEWLATPLPGTGPIGEAWLLSDRDDHPSRVAEGHLKGQTISELIRQSPELMLGKMSGGAGRFPLLLKLLDVQKMLSVQVHPTDEKDELLPVGETSKTEAWIVLEARNDSRIYAGLKPGATAQNLRNLSKQTVDMQLASFKPERDQAILINAGTVHSLGDGVVVFEVQENSDVTYRLFDWEHVDPRTGNPRDLQVEKALDCIDMSQGAVLPVSPVTETTHPYKRQRLFDNQHFRVWRLQSDSPITVGADNEPRIMVCLEGNGSLTYSGKQFVIERGTVLLLPAAVGICQFHPENRTTLLDIAGPVLS